MSLGAVLGGSGSLCAVCGASPFPSDRTTKKMLGPGFVDYALLADASAAYTCAGCAALLGGKPSKENPPLRMGHFVVAGGRLDRADGERIVEVLSNPPADIEAVGWAPSRKKHVALRCGLCSPAVLLVGCDHGTIQWETERDRRLLDAVSTLRRAARQDAIASGQYAPHTIQTLSPDVWQAAESVVAEYRPSLHLDLAVALVRRPLLTPEEVDVSVPDEYRTAAELLHPLTQQSADRRDDPIRFWSELLPRRLASAASSATLIEWLSYVVEAIHVEAFRSEVVGVLELVADMDVGEERSIMAVLRRDHRLIITYTRMVGEELRG